MWMNVDKKPSLCRAWNKNLKLTLSKAFEKSRFKKNRGCHDCLAENIVKDGPHWGEGKLVK
jgi:hypothetical protein